MGPITIVLVFITIFQIVLECTKVKQPKEAPFLRSEDYLHDDENMKNERLIANSAQFASFNRKFLTISSDLKP